MPALSTQDLISRVRELVDDEAPGDQFTDSQILANLNAAVSYYDSELAIHARRLFMTSKDITTDGSAELYRILPYLPRVVSIEQTSDDPRTLVVPMWNGFGDRFMHLGEVNIDSSLSQFTSYYVQNNQIGFLPKLSASKTERIWVMLSSPPLHYGTVNGETATTTVVFDATPTLGDMILMDDAYNEIPIMFTSTRELNTIIDWDQATLTATLAFTPETTIADEAVYSILSRIHPEHHMILPYHAAKLCRARVDEDVAEMHSLEQEIRNSMLQYLNTMTDQQAQYVQMTHEWY